MGCDVVSDVSAGAGEGVGWLVDGPGMDQELDTKLRSAPTTLSTMELKFCATCGEY